MNGGEIAVVRGSGSIIADGRTHRVELRPAFKRHRDSGRRLRSRRGRHALPDSGYSQDYSWAAEVRKDGRGGRRSGKSSHGIVRRGADQEQPHHGGGRRPGSAGAHTKCWRACGDRSPHARRIGRGVGLRGHALYCWTIFRRRRRKSGSPTSTGARPWSYPAASRSKPLGPMRNPARIFCRAERSRTRPGPSTSTSASSNRS